MACASWKEGACASAVTGGGLPGTGRGWAGNWTSGAVASGRPTAALLAAGALDRSGSWPPGWLRRPVLAGRSPVATWSQVLLIGLGGSWSAITGLGVWRFWSGCQPVATARGCRGWSRVGVAGGGWVGRAVGGRVGGAGRVSEGGVGVGGVQGGAVDQLQAQGYGPGGGWRLVGLTWAAWRSGVAVPAAVPVAVNFGGLERLIRGLRVAAQVSQVGRGQRHAAATLAVGGGRGVDEGGGAQGVVGSGSGLGGRIAVAELLQGGGFGVPGRGLRRPGGFPTGQVAADLAGRVAGGLLACASPRVGVGRWHPGQH